jgi:alpha-L-rhamnosidase
MQKAAELVGRMEDVKYFEGIANKTKSAINRNFLCEEKGYYVPNSQGANAFPLFLGIVPEDQHKAVLDNLVQDLINGGYRITTGNQATKYLYDVLDLEKRNDLAYMLATQEKYPSIGYMLANGATTVWERWELADGAYMNSHNHPMHGAFSAWFFKAIGGIRPEYGLAGEVIRIAPQVVEGLSYAQAKYTTVKGKLESGWVRNAEGIEFNIRIPWNTIAEFIVPLELKATTQIFMNGMKADRGVVNISGMDSIKVLEAENGEVQMLLRPGQYKIEIREG